MGNIYGYARVSSKDQNEARQIAALTDAGVPRKQIYLDKQSGKDFDRPRYQALMNKLHSGDVLYIKSIDRLGRNYNEIKDQWRNITKIKKADIVVLDMAVLDTRRGRDLLGTVIADIVLELLSYVAETERDFIRQRQAEGIAAAKARGVKFGAPHKEIPECFNEIRAEWENKQLTAREAGEILGVSHTTFLRWMKEMDSTKN